jgi:hypothetical protein
MKQCCSELAVVLLSFAAFGRGHAQIDFHGTLNPNGHATWVDTAIVSVPPAVDTFLTPGWGSDSTAYDTFDFPDIPDWPTLVELRARVGGLPTQQMFPIPQNGAWYSFTGVPPPPPKVTFWSLTHGIGADAGSAAPRPELRVSPSVLVDRATIQALVAGRGPARLEIADAVGNRVRAFSTDDPCRVITRVWRGDDDAGRSLPEGVYFCRLAVGGTTAVRKVLLAR